MSDVFLCEGQRVKVVAETMFHFVNFVGRDGVLECIFPPHPRRPQECDVKLDGCPFPLVFRIDEIEPI